MFRLKYLVLLLALAFVPAVVLGAYNDVTHESGAQIYISAKNAYYTIGTNTVVESYTVNTSNVSFVVEQGSIINLTSADKHEFSISSNSCNVPTYTCGTNSSSLTINCTNSISEQTITITPTTVCVTSPDGTGGTPPPGGGGGGGITKQEEETPVKTEEAVKCALTLKGAYKTSDSPAVYYITENCEKRPFSKSNVFFTYFNSWGDVKVVAKSKITTLKDDTLGFMPWGPKYDPKYGALVKIVTDPKVYLLLGTEKYWITDEDVFNKLNYKWNWIEDIDKALLDKYLTGSEISYTNHHPNYTLVKYAKSPKVYRLEPDAADSTKQVKRHIKDEIAFKALNFRWDRIVTIADTETYAEGAQLTQ